MLIYLPENYLAREKKRSKSKRDRNDGCGQTET